MYLLNARTRELKYFVGSAIPRYAILSHTWGEEEVTFKDLTEPTNQDVEKKQGYAKIVHTCDQALLEGLEYAWVDTCCIDKSSSAELSEAINSMFKWYAEADICFAYLSDVGVDQDTCSHLHESCRHAIRLDTHESDDLSIFPLFNVFMDFDDMISFAIRRFSQSRWFSRGWTLQELIAPRHLVFYDVNWNNVGDRGGLSDLIQDITGIDSLVFGRPERLEDYTIAQRMSWAAPRTTTRNEDEAYSLLGIFNINMPMLYGEGKKAFIRLQETIISRNSDHSIFAWEDPGDHKPWNVAAWVEKSTKIDGYFNSHDNIKATHSSILAPAASAFKYSSYTGCHGSDNPVPFTFTNSGLQVDLPVVELETIHLDDTFIKVFGALLDCRPFGGWTALSLFQVGSSNGVYRIHKRHGWRLQYIDALTALKAELRSITILDGKPRPDLLEPVPLVLRLSEEGALYCRAITSVFPARGWQILETQRDSNESVLRGARFSAESGSAQTITHGAVIIEAESKHGPFQIAVKFSYEQARSYVSNLYVRVLYYARGELLDRSLAQSVAMMPLEEDAYYMAVLKYLPEGHSPEAYSRYRDSTIAQHVASVSLLDRSEHQKTRGPDPNVQVSAYFKVTHIHDMQVVLLDLEARDTDRRAEPMGRKYAEKMKRSLSRKRVP